MSQSFTNRSISGIPSILLAAAFGAGCVATPAPDGNPGAEAEVTAAVGLVAPAKAAAGNHHKGGSGPCSPAKQASRWETMVNARIELPNRAALLDLGGDDGNGITLADVQETLCQGSDQGDQFGDGSDVYAFGPNQEVWFDFQPSTGKGLFITLWPGYTGKLRLENEDAHYTLQVGSQILKNGQPFQLDWTNPTLFNQEVDELYRATAASSDGPVPPAGTTCQQAHKCVSGTFGTLGFVFYPDTGFALWIDDFTAPQPVPSTPTRFDLYKK